MAMNSDSEEEWNSIDDDDDDDYGNDDDDDDDDDDDEEEDVRVKDTYLYGNGYPNNLLRLCEERLISQARDRFNRFIFCQNDRMSYNKKCWKSAPKEPVP